jgi:hypothetical protein
MNNHCDETVRSLVVAAPVIEIPPAGYNRPESPQRDGQRSKGTFLAVLRARLTGMVRRKVFLESGPLGFRLTLSRLAASFALFLAGGGVIAIGLTLLLSGDLRHAWLSDILFALGMAGVIAPRKESDSGLGLVLTGVALLADRLDLIPLNVGPLLVIAGGGVLFVCGQRVRVCGIAARRAR